MSVVERTSEGPDHWPTLDDLRLQAADSSLVLLPDRIDMVEGRAVATFRLDAQGLRVAASQAGLNPLLYRPLGAELAMYTENAADWVLPVVVAAALAFPFNVGATLVADWIEGSSPHQAAQEVLYREAVYDHGRWELYEAQGTPKAVVQLLRGRTIPDPPAIPPAPPSP